MQKIILIFLTACLLSFILGCSKTEQKEVSNTNENEMENTTGENDSAVDNEDPEEKEEETNEETKASEEEKEEEPEQDPGLTVYRPEVGSIKKFSDGEDIVLTEEVIASNDQYVQLSLTLGGNQSIQIYEWTAERISLVYEEVSVADSKQNILDSFTPKNDSEILLSVNGESSMWEVKESGAKLELSVGSYEEVYVLQKVTDEVQGEDTIYTRYYAPGVGLIKEEFEVTGEYGYTGEMEVATMENKEE
ncbi:hypothetical protein FIU87_18680 [Bacillus sp. THAF10]|nr:hypothetical protein FIU87_18680 [Bacillus sp. THAF10]